LIISLADKKFTCLEKIFVMDLAIFPFINGRQNFSNQKNNLAEK
jgi:hypothetical protein